MNKKIYGMMALGIATGFWTCGSGDILQLNGGDEIMNIPMGTENDGAVITDRMTEANCPECFAGGMPSSSSKKVVVTSSSSSPSVSQSSSSQKTVRSSSSRNPVLSSSSAYVPPTPGSSTSVSSSSAKSGAGQIGTCAPVQATYEKDEAGGKGVVWKFTRDPSVAATQLISASFNWSFEGATPDKASATGANGLSQSVKYSTSGPHTAKVAISIGAAVYQVDCSPVQVNGEPITGCKCTTEATSIDYTATPTATWSVTGCTTGAGLNLAYQWDGAPGEASYSPTFTAAAASYAPVLKVANDDNTVVDVTCPAIKITEGPEYIIKETQGAGAIKLPAGSTIVSLEVDAYNNTVFCQVARADTPSGALNGTVNKVAIEGSDYIAVSMPAGSLKKGTTLEFVLDGPATCGVQ
ncbi:MAG: hypothetical protein II835_14570 [Fibrobacter sp.]|nr:hypothetical protein [Fibrobacter sp.]